MPWVHLFDAVGVRRHVDEVRRSFASRPSPERRRRPRPAIPAPPSRCTHLPAQTRLPPSLQVRRVHAICFPEERPEDDETDAAFWDRVTSFHDQDAVEWFLLFDETKSSDPFFSSSSPPPPPPPPLTPPPPPLPRPSSPAAAMPYADSVYGLHLAVVPGGATRERARGSECAGGSSGGRRPRVRFYPRRRWTPRVGAVGSVFTSGAVRGSSRRARGVPGARPRASFGSDASSTRRSRRRSSRSRGRKVGGRRRRHGLRRRAWAGAARRSWLGPTSSPSSDYCRANVYPKLAAAAAVLLVVYVARDRAPAD